MNTSQLDRLLDWIDGDEYTVPVGMVAAARVELAALRAALTDAIESVESAPERCAGASMLHSPQVGTRQVAAWKAALTPARKEQDER